MFNNYKTQSDDRGGLPNVKDVNFNTHLLHLFPKKLEYTFFFWDTRYNIPLEPHASEYNDRGKKSDNEI